MAGRKWNNQGGSSRDGFDFRPKKAKQQPNIPSVEDLRESTEVSFKIVRPRKPKPNYGQFGDEIWTADPYIDIPDIEIPEIKEPELPGELQDPRIYKDKPEERSIDLVPYLVQDEYELVVKYPGGLVLKISSGQAYAARQQINDPRFDLCLVIDSSAPIALDGKPASKINTISLSRSSQNPIFSLYNWLLTKIAIATDYSAKQPDPILSRLQLRANTLRLPPTQFVANSIVCDLFYSSGLQPNQICLNATNKVLLYESSRTKDDRLWAVTFAGEVLPLCLSINKLPFITIAFLSGTLEEIEAGSGNAFVIVISIDLVQADSLDVDIELLGDAIANFYTTTGINSAGIGEFFVTIPAGELSTEITIEPLANPQQQDPVTVVPTLLPSTIYDLGVAEVTATILPKIEIKPTVTLTTDKTSLYPQDSPDGIFNVVVSLDRTLTVDLVVELEFNGTALFDSFQVNFNPVSSSQLTVVIPAGETSSNITIKPNVTPFYDIDRTIIPKILGTTRYSIDIQQLELTVTPTPIRIAVLPTSQAISRGGSFVVNISTNRPTGIDTTVTINYLSNGFLPFDNFIANVLNWGEISTITIPAGSTTARFVLTEQSTEGKFAVDKDVDIGFSISTDSALFKGIVQYTPFVVLTKQVRSSAGLDSDQLFTTLRNFSFASNTNRFSVDLSIANNGHASTGFLYVPSDIIEVDPTPATQNKFVAQSRDPLDDVFYSDSKISDLIDFCNQSGYRYLLSINSTAVSKLSTEKIFGAQVDSVELSRNLPYPPNNDRLSGFFNQRLPSPAGADPRLPYYNDDESFARGKIILDWHFKSTQLLRSQDIPGSIRNRYIMASCFQFDSQNIKASKWIPFTLNINGITAASDWNPPYASQSQRIDNFN